MIFAHVPASFLLAYAVRKRWWRNLNKKQIFWALFFAVFGGIFPDVDLFYYYLSSATFSHHEVFTHGLFFYIILVLLAYLASLLLKKPIIKICALLFFIGVVSHFIADSIGAGVVWFYPFSKQLIGLDSLNFYRQTWPGSNFFAINYSLEGLIYFLLVIFIIKKFIKSQIGKKWAYFISLLFLILGVFSIITTNKHLFHNNGDIYFSDYDNDKIINKYDLDIDNDGILNINDSDIDNNGEDNSMAIYKETFSLQNTWYDITEGGLIEIPLRFGFVTNTDFVERIFGNVGIFLRTEMEEDYKINPQDYINTPKVKSFERTAENWQAFLKHKNKLLRAETPMQEYDILFFSDGYIALALWPENKQWLILEASPKEKKVIQTTLDDIIKRKGPVHYLGRLLPKPVNKLY